MDGSRTKKGKKYDKVYSQVVGWTPISILLLLVALERWKTTQVDYVQAFTQAPIEKYLYLKFPAGSQVEYVDNNEYALNIHRNI